MMVRGGFHLLEVVLTLSLVAGPLTVSMGLIQANARAGRFILDRAAAREVLLDLTELLVGEPISELRNLAQTGSPSDLDSLLAYRASGMPAETRELYLRRVAIFRNRIRFTLTEGVGGNTRLVRLTLSVDSGRLAPMRVSCLLRPEARPLPPMPPGGGQISD